MNKQLVKAIKNREVELAAIDKKTATRIQKIAESTGADASSIINASVQLLEKSLGREVVVKDSKSPWNLIINHFKKYNRISQIEPDNGK